MSKKTLSHEVMQISEKIWNTSKEWSVKTRKEEP